MDIIKIELPEQVIEIITKLIEHGFEAYVVGGCVRDSILNRVPEDWDITTSASPCHVKEIFKRTVDTGIVHGTVTVMVDKKGYEVTTYRIDGEYDDGRHPKQVTFTKSLTQDLMRRDFTMNAMAYNHKEGLIDLFDGLVDIKEQRISCVGSATKRFEEDALRMLRAVRFAAQLNFDIAIDTLDAIKKGADRLALVSAERIRVELSKLLVSKYPEKLLIAYKTGITKVVLSEFNTMMETTQENKYHIYNVGIHSMKLVEWLTKESEGFVSLESKVKVMLVWAALLHDVSKPETKTIDSNGVAHFYRHAEKGAIRAKEILQKLKFDNETIEMVKRLIFFHDYQYEKVRFGCSPTGIRRAINRIGDDIMELLFLLQEADTRAKNPDKVEEKLEQLVKAKKIYSEIKRKKECINLKTLALTGYDLIKMGYPQGEKIGKELQRLLEHVLEHPEDNEKEKLMEIVKK